MRSKRPGATGLQNTTEHDYTQQLERGTEVPQLGNAQRPTDSNPTSNIKSEAEPTESKPSVDQRIVILGKPTQKTTRKETDEKPKVMETKASSHLKGSKLLLSVNTQLIHPTTPWLLTHNISDAISYIPNRKEP